MSALFVLDSLFASACDSSEPFDSFVRMLARSAGSLELGVGVFPRHPGTRRPLLGDERTICPRVRPRCVRGACAGGLATLTSQTSNLSTRRLFTFTFTLICHHGQTHSHRSRGDTTWEAQRRGGCIPYPDTVGIMGYISTLPQRPYNDKGRVLALWPRARPSGS
jgi:hypothetical protein